jgi:hypothetical protein
MSADFHVVEVFLSVPQFRKYKKGEPFQLSNTQLQSSVGKHKVDIHLEKKDYKKLINAVKNGKGYRFSEKNVKGGSLWGTFKSGLSKVGKFIKSNVSKEDVKNNFYTVKCEKCGWWGSSKFLEGGGQIADTGDYDDCYCPVCGNADPDEIEL